MEIPQWNRFALFTYGYRVPNGTENGKQQDGTEMIEKESIGHEITGIEDNGWQHVEEESRRRQWGNPSAIRVEEQQANHNADNDQKTGFRKYR